MIVSTVCPFLAIQDHPRTCMFVRDLKHDSSFFFLKWKKSFIGLNSSSYTSFFALMSVKYICSMFKIQLRKLFLFVRFCLLVSFGSFFYLVPFLTCKECITAGKWGEQINVKVNIFKHIKGMEKCLYTLLKSWHHWRNIWNKQK